MADETEPESVVLEEQIDPNYVPTEEEVLQYAKWLGMDLEYDTDFFWIAREGLLAPLLEPWKPCKVKNTDDVYYFNFDTGESTWDHPCDTIFKEIFLKEKRKREEERKSRDYVLP